MEMTNYTQALDAFTDAVKLNTNMAEVIIYRFSYFFRLKGILIGELQLNLAMRAQV